MNAGMEETIALIKRLLLAGDTSKKWQPSATAERPPLPLEIQLGSNALRFSDEDGWLLDGGDGTRSMAENVRLRAELAQTKDEAHSAQEQLVGATEEANMAKYQNQLLLEMLAVSRVVESRLKTQLQRERARQEELTRELEAAYSKLLAQLSAAGGGSAPSQAAPAVLLPPQPSSQPQQQQQRRV